MISSMSLSIILVIIKQITNVNEGDGTNCHTWDDLDVAIFRAEGEKDRVNIRSSRVDSLSQHPKL